MFLALWCEHERVKRVVKIDKIIIVFMLNNLSQAPGDCPQKMGTSSNKKFVLFLYKLPIYGLPNRKVRISSKYTYTDSIASTNQTIK